MQDAQTIISAAFQHLKDDLNIDSNYAAARWLSEHTAVKVSNVDVLRWRRGELAKSAKVLIPLIVAYYEAAQADAPAEPQATTV